MGNKDIDRLDSAFVPYDHPFLRAAFKGGGEIIVLFAVTGELGAGKTLTSVALTYKNWYTRRRTTFSNIHLYRIPHYFIKGINQIDQAREGTLLLDEMWSICDSRMSITKRNRFTGNILMKSRKRGLIYLFSAQVMHSIDRRIRAVVDFTCVPTLNRNETIIKANVFRTGTPKMGSYLHTLYFYTPEIFSQYDTNEEVSMEEQIDEPMEIRFQENFNPEHGNFCTCSHCKGRVFDTWEEADKAGERFWKKRFQENPELKVM